MTAKCVNTVNRFIDEPREGYMRWAVFKSGPWRRCSWLIVLLLVAPMVSGQTLTPGLEIGYNQSFMNEENNENQTLASRKSLNGMISVQIALVQSLSMQTGIRYVKFKNNVDENFVQPAAARMVDPANGSYSISQRYLSIPLRLQMLLVKSPGLFVFMGSETGRLLSANITVEHPAMLSAPQTATDRVSVTDQLARFSTSLNSGIGSTFEVGNHLLYIQAQYAISLTPAARTTSGEAIFRNNWRTHELNLSLGFQF